MSTATVRAVCLLFGAALLWTAEPLPSRAQDAAGSASARPSGKTRGKKQLRSERRQRVRTERARAAPAEGDKPKRRRARSSRGSGSAAPSKPKHAREAGPPESTAAAEAAQTAAAGVDAEIVKDGETSVKVMKFSGLGIEGRLKSPQLVYFVQRVRAEFERPALPHRSFMPELERTTAREPIR